jgi:fatty-acid desaturase
MRSMSAGSQLLLKQNQRESHRGERKSSHAQQQKPTHRLLEGGSCVCGLCVCGVGCVCVVCVWCGLCVCGVGCVCVVWAVCVWINSVCRIVRINV